MSRWPLLLIVLAIVALAIAVPMLATAQGSRPPSSFVPPVVSGGCRLVDSGCRRRQDAQVLLALGQRDAAVALMCQDAAVRRAMIDAGTPCPGSSGDDGDRALARLPEP